MAKSTRIAADLPRLRLGALETISADDLRAEGFHDYVSVDSGSLEGRNLTGVTISESEWTNLEISDADLSGARISDSRLAGLSGTSLRGEDIAMRNTKVSESRVGVLDLGEADVRTVLFDRCKLGFVGLRGAKLLDLTFNGCVIEELDLTNAEVSRLSLRGSAIQTLTLSLESAAGLDLRGAEVTTLAGIRSLHGLIIDAQQLVQFAGQFAHQLGARVL